MKHLVHIPHGTQLPDFLLLVCICHRHKAGQLSELSFCQGGREALLKFTGGIQDNVKAGLIQNCINIVVVLHALKVECYLCRTLKGQADSHAATAQTIVQQATY